MCTKRPQIVYYWDPKVPAVHIETLNRAQSGPLVSARSGSRADLETTGSRQDEWSRRLRDGECLSDVIRRKADKSYELAVEPAE